MKSNRILLAALLAWTGILSALVAGAIFFSQPQPIAAQTGVVRFSTVSAGSFYRAVPRTAITVTMNGWLTPTGTYQRIQNSSGAVATSGAKIAVMPAGTILTLINVSANTLTFTETGTLISAGNIALGQNDAATLMSDGTSWYQVGGSNN